MIRCALGLSLVLALAAPGAASAAELTEAAARRFLAEQEAAWNAGRLDAYFGRFTKDAVFVDQHRTPKETIVYGRSSLDEARTYAAKARKTWRSVERGSVRSIRIAPDGKSARVLGSEVTTLSSAARTRTVCAQTEQTLVLSGGRILSRGQTDTIVKCRPAGR